MKEPREEEEVAATVELRLEWMSEPEAVPAAKDDGPWVMMSIFEFSVVPVLRRCSMWCFGGSHSRYANVASVKCKTLLVFGC